MIGSFRGPGFLGVQREVLELNANVSLVEQTTGYSDEKDWFRI